MGIIDQKDRTNLSAPVGRSTSGFEWKNRLKSTGLGTDGQPPNLKYEHAP